MINDEQTKALFGETAAWEFLFIRRPPNLSSMLAAMIENPKACKAADNAIKELQQEQKTKPARPTRCLLCDKDFLRQLPAGLVLMSPATRKGPSAMFVLCDGCWGKPDLEGRVRAYLYVRLGAQETRWGHG